MLETCDDACLRRLPGDCVFPPAQTPPRLILRIPPEYPPLAKAARIEGVVKLAALIDENGEVERLRLISGHPLLVKATFDAVKQWRFRPATQAEFLSRWPSPSRSLSVSAHAANRSSQRFFHHVQRSHPHTYPGIHGNFALFPHKPHRQFDFLNRIHTRTSPFRPPFSDRLLLFRKTQMQPPAIQPCKNARVSGYAGTGLTP